MRSSVEDQAKRLARENIESDKDVSAVFWFPHDREVRLLELQNVVPCNDGNEIHPFYFQADPSDDLNWVTAIALIRPDEFKQLTLPATWGDWDRAIKLESSK